MGTALLLVLFERDIVLRKVLKTEYGLKESGAKTMTSPEGTVVVDSGARRRDSSEVDSKTANGTNKAHSLASDRVGNIDE